MLKKYFFLCCLYFNLILFANDNMASLLGEFAQKSDLSNKTKQESSGFLLIYTRQDLDRMNVHYLKDFIDKIPFIRYNEDNNGMASPFYTPHQPYQPDLLRVYINDRELVTPFTGNTIKLFGQMSMGFIDHIEIYMGIPSQTIGIQPAWIVIKCYTKDPKREDTNLIGTQIGSYGTKEIYGYSAKQLSDYSYLFYINSRDLNRKKTHYKTNSLSKDRESSNFYGEIAKKGLKFEIQALKGSMDNFIGNSINFDPKQNSMDYDYFYTGIYYQTCDTKAFINYSLDKTNHFISSKTYLGIMNINNTPYYFQDSSTQVKKEVSDAQFYKIFKTKHNKLSIGLQHRYKHLDVKELSFGKIHITNDTGFSKECILSAFIEDNYLINDSHMITGALKYDKNYNNGRVRDYNTASGRLGYIYNTQKWTSKTFLFFSETIPSMQTLFFNRSLYHQNYDPDKERRESISTKITYKRKKDKTSLLIGHTLSKKSIYFDGKSYKNLDYDFYTDTISLRYTYNFNPLNKIILNGWVEYIYKEGSPIDSGNKNYGGLISVYNSIGKFDFYNNLTYKHWNDIDKDGWNLNSSVTYRYSRKLSFFIKGENILDKALKSYYVSTNPLTKQINYLDDVNSIDRRIWIGMEYQF